MLPIFLQRAFAKPFSLLLCAALAFLLSACGGGGGSAGRVPGGSNATPDPATLTPKASIVLLNASNGTVTSLAPGQTATAKVTLVDAAGAPAANQIVKFTSDALIVFLPLSGTALTDANGVAVIAVAPASADLAGASSITATATVGGKPATAAVNVAVLGSPASRSALSISLISSTNGPVTVLGAGQTATVRVTATDSAGAPAANQIIKFTSDQLIAFLPGTGTALTDSNGVAVILIAPASPDLAGATSVTASATLGGKDVSALVNLAVGAAPNLKPVLNMTLVNASNGTVTTLGAGQSATAKVIVLDGAGLPLANQIVKFSSDPLIAFLPASGTALTDANGLAIMGVVPGSPDQAGATSITASTTINGKTFTTFLNVAVGASASARAVLNLTLIDASNASISTLAPGTAATARATLVDSTGAPAVGQIVKFTSPDTLVAFLPAAGTALTNAQGVAVIGIQAANPDLAGATSIVASATIGAKTETSTANLAIGPAASAPKATLTIVGSGNVPVSTLSGGQLATVRVALLNSAGLPAVNEIVKFTTTDPLVTFTPGSASSLTDGAGIATISIQPTTINSAGATAITATAVVAGKTATAVGNLLVGAAPLTLGPLSFTTPAPPSLPAFSTLQLNIPLTSGGQPATSSSGLSLSSLCVGDGTATLVLGSLNAGIQTATYTNKGCVRGSDTITAQVGAAKQSISFGVGAANIGAIQFLGSDLSGNSSIVLKGSGGLGRSESALLTFRVVDQNNQGLAGVDVDFSASTTTGGLTVTPARGTTDSTGRVTTTVTAGTIPTPVRVFAQASRNGSTISGLSDTLTISTGLPIQKNMSLSADAYNIEGWENDNIVSNLTVRLADQYGNPISDGTAVSFVTEGGAVGSSAQGACITSDGGCTVKLRSQDFRPLNGRVTVLAYVQGLENFTDTNGDGQYSCTTYVAPDGSVPAVYRPLVDTCTAGGEPFVDQADPFLDAGILTSVVGFEKLGVYSSLDGSYQPANGDLPIPYNHAVYSPAGNGHWGLNYIWRSAEITFSGNTAFMQRQNCAGASCVDWNLPANPSIVTVTAGASCAPATVKLRFYDLHNNPLPAGTTVTAIDTDHITISTFAPDKVASTNAIGGTYHTFVVKPDTTCSLGTFSVKVTTPLGLSTIYNFTTN